MIKTEKQNLVVQKHLCGLAKKLSFITLIIIALAVFGVLSKIYAQQTGGDQSQAASTPSAVAASGKAAGPATETAAAGEKKNDGVARALGLLIPLKAAAKTGDK